MGFGKDGKGAILREQTEIAIGSLANHIGKIMPGLVLTEDFRLLKSEIVAIVTDITAADGEGLRLYLAQPGLTLAQTEAAIEANGPTGRDDRPAAEQAERYVKLIGVLETGDPADLQKQFIGGDDDQGLIMRIKPRWTFPNVASQASWNWFLYNDGDAFATGATLRLMATHYGVWLT